MSQTWYYARGSQQFGPVTTEQLIGLLGTGQVKHADLVWTEGLSQWVPAQSVPRLATPAAAEPVIQNSPESQNTDFAPPVPHANAASAGYSPQSPALEQAYSPSWATSGAQPVNPIHPGVQPVLGYHSMFGQQHLYAGFWMRFAAAIIDGIITGIAGAIVGGVIGFVAGASGIRPNSPEWMGVSAVIQIVSAAMTWLYFALMESSANQGTLGKMAVGLKVTDLDGAPIGFGRATGRHFAKYISMLMLMIGYMMAGWTEKKQAMHDILAGALVVKKNP